MMRLKGNPIQGEKGGRYVAEAGFWDFRKRRAKEEKENQMAKNRFQKKMGQTLKEDGLTSNVDRIAHGNKP